MSLRLKIVAALVLLAAAATAAVGLSSYVSTRRELNQVVDGSLRDAAARADQFPIVFQGVGRPFPGGQGRNNGRGAPPRVFDTVLAQLIASDGTVLGSPRSGQLPVGNVDLVVASGNSPSSNPRDVSVDGEPYRMMTVGIPGLGAVQLARSARETQEALDVIRNRTLLLAAIVSAGAAIAGWLIGRQVTRRLSRLTQAADNVALTGRLDVEVPVTGADETGRLGSALNGMLGALARSRQQQHQLVQDAGHELRTPLTSLRTNVSVLRRFEELTPSAREQIVADLDSETKELTDLVNELVELATDSRDGEPEQDCDLGALCEQAAARVRRRTGRDITVTADESRVRCRAGAIDRAVLNVIDNAAKFSNDGDIEVVVDHGRVAVSDRGPGIPADDVPHIFDRFFRSVASRSQPGSGLGLAIVRDIIEAHGGTVFAGAREGGGATVGFTLPTLSTAPVFPPPSAGR
jgi:two-component system, OmpR family, sensor histidine kinase MprB